MSKRRKYSPEFKRGAIEQTRQAGVSCSQVARELGIGGNVLTRWVCEAVSAGRQAFGGTGTPRDEKVTSVEQLLDVLWAHACGRQRPDIDLHAFPLSEDQDAFAAAGKRKETSP